MPIFQDFLIIYIFLNYNNTFPNISSRYSLRHHFSYIICNPAMNHSIHSPSKSFTEVFSKFRRFLWKHSSKYLSMRQIVFRAGSSNSNRTFWTCRPWLSKLLCILSFSSDFQISIQNYVIKKWQLIQKSIQLSNIGSIPVMIYPIYHRYRLKKYNTIKNHVFSLTRYHIFTWYWAKQYRNNIFEKVSYPF